MAYNSLATVSHGVNDANPCASAGQLVLGGLLFVFILSFRVSPYISLCSLPLVLVLEGMILVLVIVLVSQLIVLLFKGLLIVLVLEGLILVLVLVLVNQVLVLLFVVYLLSLSMKAWSLSLSL